MGMLNKDIEVIAPKAVKVHFNIGLEASISGKITDPDSKKRQYYHNKTKAVDIAKRLTPESIQKEIFELTHCDDPNVYDSILNFKYYVNRLNAIPSVKKQEIYNIKAEGSRSLKRLKMESLE
jgi:hypothetical protein